MMLVLTMMTTKLISPYMKSTGTGVCALARPRAVEYVRMNVFTDISIELNYLTFLTSYNSETKQRPASCRERWNNGMME